jgi:two-component system sensor histidine kinase KdpD
LTDLVENLLASTRLEGGAANLRLSSELIEDIFAEAAAHVHADSRHTVTIEPPSEMLMVRADSKLIVQVIVNLIGNALKYTPSGSTIRLSAKQNDHVVIVSVEDDGPGISPEEKEKIFEMFYVGDNTASSGRKSLGLGLALCRTIVNTHGGKIWVEDNSPHGAVFSFTLPAEEVAEHG